MTKVRLSMLVAAIMALSGAMAASALSAAPAAKKPAKPVAFLGKYSGQASSKADGTTVTLAATGSGSGSLIGNGSITGAGTADSSQQPCPPFLGTGTIKGAKGTLSFKVASGSKGCGDEGGHVFSLTGYLTVTKATGVLKKAKGSLRLTGVYDRDNGSFQIKLAGKLKR